MTALALALATCLPDAMSARADFDTHAAGFAVSVDGDTSAYRDLPAFVMPGASLAFEIGDGPPGDYRATARGGEVIARGDRAWQWRAPSYPGVYDIRIDGPARGDAITLHVFVLVPASRVRGGVLNGYRIGEYPSPSSNPLYQPPRGYVEVVKDTLEVNLTPHFRVSQFLCKEDPTSRFPKYLFVKTRLVLELEAILERVNAAGFHVDTLHVLSGYRTPYYNRAIGDVRFSMHQWGAAADIYIDRDNKGVMDDLNHDGRVDMGDSQLLYDSIQAMLAAPSYRRFQGGMGVYPGTSAHPPFVHVDVRGVRARWRG